MEKRIDLSIIILSYNTRALLAQTLSAVEKGVKKSRFAIEVIVVDNGSNDASGEMVKQQFPRVHLIRLPKNIGYPKGNNTGIKKAKGRYILLLNSDVILDKDTLDTMIPFMNNHSDVGVATCKLIFPSGEIDPACRRGFPNPWAAFTYFSGLEKLFPHNRLFSSYHLGYLPLDTVHEIDSPAGAFYLIRKDVITQIGLLDEDYFMYAEDLDWSYRIKKAGWKIMYVPHVQSVHVKKQSGRKSKYEEVKRRSTAAFYDTMKIFYRKHYLKQYSGILMWFFFICIDIKKAWALSRI